jgi:outer membrane cobalamin receptor
VSIAGEVYRNSLTDLIDFATAGYTPGGSIIFTPRNVQRARTEGVEATVRAKHSGWGAEAGYAYLHAVDLTHDLPLDRRARHSGRFTLTREVPLLAGGMVDVTLRYTGRAESIGTDESGQSTVTGFQEAFLALDARTSLQLWDGTELSVGVDNLTNGQPLGWPGANERRVYAGVRTRVVP